MNKLLLTVLLCIALGASCSTVDTVNIYSNAMHREIKCVIVKPGTYLDQYRTFPVVYLLHGYSDRYDTWIRKVPALREYTDRYGMIIVCPDGGYSSWYFDSPLDTAYRFETFVSREVVAFVDKHYRTMASREYRAITGLSMGGHGALFLAFRHAGTYGAAGSMSGGVDMRPFPDNWDIAKRIGDEKIFGKNWEAMSVVTVADQLGANAPALMIECGTDDFFFKVNLQLHHKLLAMKIPHDWVERPGQHSWDYWSNAVEYQLLFFHRYFTHPHPPLP